MTFTAPKLAHVLSHLTPSVYGPVVVAPIGSPAETVVSHNNLTWTGTSKRLFEAPRPIDSNKGMYGHILLIGGAFGKAGAPSMASLACLRAGRRPRHRSRPQIDPGYRSPHHARAHDCPT